MNINVGDYVRNKYGIAKVLEISEDVVKNIQTIKFDRPICFWANPNTGEERNRTNILPITPNIDLSKIKFGKLIDLIEAGDIVNRCEVDEIELRDFGHGKIKKILKCNLYEDDDSMVLLCEDDIETIVTKEQMEAMEYKIER